MAAQSSDSIKILLLGPCKVGKTSIANFLADRAQQGSVAGSSEYTPTVGVRILEFDVQDSHQASWKGSKLSIELWDVSGDRKYDACLPAITKGVAGIIFVHNPENESLKEEVKYWTKTVIHPLGLTDEQVMVFGHRPSAVALPKKEKKNAKLDKYFKTWQQVPTSLNAEPALIKGRFEEFADVVNAIAARRAEKEMEEAGGGV